MFPVKRINEIVQNPEGFQLLERLPALNWDVPFTLFPYSDNLLRFCILDVETTGLDENDEIIELGCVTGLVDLDVMRIAAVHSVTSLYHQPSKPIPALITDLSGITNEQVKGHTLSYDALTEALGAPDIIIAHNAGFDRGFIDRYVQRLGYPALSIPWACSIKDVNWRDMGFESQALSYLLFQQGYFFNGHRASDDCLAVANLFVTQPDALAQVINAHQTPMLDLRVTSRFQVKDNLKSLGCEWDGEARQWHKVIDEKEAEKLATAILALDLPAYISVDKRVIPATERYR